MNSINHADLLVKPGRIVDLADFDPRSTVISKTSTRLRPSFTPT